MDIETSLIVMYAIIGMLEIILGLPLLYGKVKRNIFYGFRLPKTLSNDEIWYKANKYTGKDLIYSGIFLIVCSFILFIFRYSVSILDFTIILTFLLLASVCIMIIKGLLFLKKL